MALKNFHLLSFRYAFEGLIQALKQEPNLKFHLLAAIFVIIISYFLQISKQDWINIFLLIGMVLSVELTNTAIEVIVDKFTEQEHPGAKMAKDIAAGSVLIVAITAVIVGIIIFIPYLV